MVAAMLIFVQLLSIQAVIAGVSLEQETPITSLCVEECSDITARADGLDSCPSGYECRYNGCGHTCEKVTIPEGCTECKDLGCYNDACDIDGMGCPMCIGVGRRQARGLYQLCIDSCTHNPILRAVGLGGCPCGFECKYDGCSRICQPATGRKSAPC